MAIPLLYCIMYVCHVTKGDNMINSENIKTFLPKSSLNSSAVFCIIVGDFNTYFPRSRSFHTSEFRLFCDSEKCVPCSVLLVSSVDYAMNVALHI